jgi:AcrR family transcriptional regulator
MIEAVVAHGYAATTVDEIVDLAGVSTKTLYKHFSSKQECFLCTYDAVMEELAGRIGAAWREGDEREDDRAAGLARGLDAFVFAIEQRPEAMRLALVEVLAAGPAVLGRIERAQLGFERIIAQGLAQACGGVAPSPLLARGIAGGIWYVTRARLLSGAIEQLERLGGELLNWMLAYDSPAVQLLAPWLTADGWDEARAGPRLARAPRGLELSGTAAGGLAPSGAAPSRAASRRIEPLDRERALRGDERTRILWTAARIAGREGYAELTVARILDEAEVPDEAFFALYEGVGECFVAALELLSAQALARVERAGCDAPDWPSAVRMAADALMRHIAADPVFARCAFVEIFAAGAVGAACRERLLRRLVELFERAAPAGPAGLVVAEAIVGGVWNIVHHQVVRDAAYALPGVVDHVAYIALAPVIGAEQAARTILEGQPADDRWTAGGQLAPLPVRA